MKKKNILIAGAGSFGTAIANVIAKAGLDILLYDRDINLLNEIKNKHKNTLFYPQIKLNNNIIPINSLQHSLKDSIVFLAIPSHAINQFIQNNIEFIRNQKLLINLAKGFGDDIFTVPEALSKIIDIPILSLKGPTFAHELIYNIPVGMTLGYNSLNDRDYVCSILKNTCIKLDFSKDILGVELISIIKNIYAIIFGVIDTLFNTASSRFMIFTELIKEIANIMKICDINVDIFTKYCGIGDITLTMLNDLSRNRTLGLLIGKGFYSNAIASSIVAEGKRSLFLLIKRIKEHVKLSNDLYLMKLYNYFNGDFDYYELRNKFIN
jgi:glycerol-3-phosphate dehydrogenase (NAD(P)+)